ncbi:hypothetical protein JOD24_000656 [Kroppenstedtia sanguinis]|uniref:Uncharacterized protein n=1 Tax=Kroppenstedtia sanguinis TaxID=1380684 RepID=A0ABW4C8W8_9BACL
MKRQPGRASISKAQEARRWAWLKNKMEQLAEHLPSQTTPPQHPFLPPPPRDQEPPRGFSNSGPPRGRGGEFDGLGWDAPFGPPPRREEGAPKRPDERSPRDRRDPRLDEWWGAPMMDWGRPQDREMPPWAPPPRERNRGGEVPSWDQAPRDRDGDREREAPPWSGSPRDREDSPYWSRSPRDRSREEEVPSMDRSPRQWEDSSDRRLEEGERWEERPKRKASRRDWEELPSLFDETEHMNSSGIRPRRNRSRRRKY